MTLIIGDVHGHFSDYKWLIENHNESIQSDLGPGNLRNKYHLCRAYLRDS
jgi:hypothetical protein